MRLALMIAILAVPVQAEPVPVSVPSGQEVALVEILLDDTPGALWARFRFLAPGIARVGGGIGPKQAAQDMDHLCEAVARPYIGHHGLVPERVVISLSDRPVAFGAKAPEATQYFEAYRLENDTCVWEGY